MGTLTAVALSCCTKMPTFDAVVEYNVDCYFKGSDEDKAIIDEYTEKVISILDTEIGKVSGLTIGSSEHTYTYPKCTETILPKLKSDIKQASDKASITFGNVPLIAGQMTLDLSVIITFDDTQSLVWHNRISYPQLY